MCSILFCILKKKVKKFACSIFVFKRKFLEMYQNSFCLFVRWRWQRRMFSRCCLPPTCCSWRMWILSVCLLGGGDRGECSVAAACRQPAAADGCESILFVFVRWRWQRRMFSRCCLPPTCCSWRMWILSVCLLGGGDRGECSVAVACRQPAAADGCESFLFVWLGGGDRGECSVAAASCQPAAADGCESFLFVY